MAPKPKKKTDETTEKTPETGAKPGPKTTEFWITIACTLIGTLMSAYGAYKSNDALVAIGGSIAGGSGGLYAISRGIAKKGASGA